MPKSKDVFAFRDFDADKILSRNFFDNLIGADGRRLFPKNIPDNEILKNAAEQVDECLKCNDLTGANSIIINAKKLHTAVNAYHKKISHVSFKRLSAYSLRLITKAQKGIDVDDRSNRCVILSEKYTRIAKEISALLEVIQEIFYPIEQRVKLAYRKRFAAKLKELRLKNNLKKNELASLLGITPQSYSQIELCKNDASFLTLIRLTEVFKIDANKLFS